MHEDDAALGGNVFQPVYDGVLTLFPSNGEKQAVGIALKDPRRWIGNVFTWKNADDHRYVVALLQPLQRVQKHWLPRDPSELLELGGAGSAAAAARRDDHANIPRRHLCEESLEKVGDVANSANVEL
jgi:hypothetical protein